MTPTPDPVAAPTAPCPDDGAASADGFYEDPAVYDILHARGTAEEVDGLERLACRYVRTEADPLGPVWLEPACGTGRYLRLARERGTRIVGFDLNPDMVRYARHRMRAPAAGGDAKLSVSDMRDFGHELGPASVDFAFNLINTVRHLERDADVLEHLAQVARVLKPGGVYAVGISLSAYGLEMPSEDVWSGARGRCRVRQCVQYEPPKPTTRRERIVSELAITRPSGTEHRSSVYHLRSYDRVEWDGLLARSAMRKLAEVDEVGEPIGRRNIGYGIDVLAAR